MARSRSLVLGAFVLVASASSSVACKDDKPAPSGVDAALAIPSATPASSAGALVDAGEGDASTLASDERGRRGHGGPSAMLFQAARGLDLKDEQKAKLDAAEKSAHEGADAGAVDGGAKDAARDAAKELHNELIAGIKAGKIETAKLEPRYAVLTKLAAAERDKEAAALNALHAALEPAQRKATVASVRAKQTLREDRSQRMRNFGLRAGPDGGKSDDTKRRAERLVRGLELDAEQQKKLEAIVPNGDAAGGRPDPAEMKKRTEALLVAFEKDTFDAKKVDAFDAKQARAAVEGEAKLLAQIVPILKPEQREKLADRMTKGPSPHARRGGFGHRVEPEDED